VQNAHHIWIDHNELWSDRAHDIDYYDGLIDITHATDFVTVSWNILHDRWKTSLIGHDDDNAAEDTGHLTVTYHHNYWYNLDARGPSIRFGTDHVYDNHYANSVTAIHPHGRTRHPSCSWRTGLNRPNGAAAVGPRPAERPACQPNPTVMATYQLT
jgi:pectate lyase